MKTIWRYTWRIRSNSKSNSYNLANSAKNKKLRIIGMTYFLVQCSKQRFRKQNLSDSGFNICISCLGTKKMSLFYYAVSIRSITIWDKFHHYMCYTVDNCKDSRRALCYFLFDSSSLSQFADVKSKYPSN